MDRIKSITLLISLVALGGCSAMQDWMCGTLFEYGDTAPRQAPGIIQCAECGQGVRLDPNHIPDQRVVVYEHGRTPPLVSYGPTIAESRILGEGYSYPKHSRREMVIKSEPSRPTGAFIVGGQWCEDLCYDCNKERMDKYRAKRETEAKLTRMEATEKVYRKMIGWIVGD